MAFESLVKAYNDFKLSFIKEIGDINTYLREVPFVDEALIKSSIKYCQKRHQEIVREIELISNSDVSDSQRLPKLLEAEKEVRIEMAMLISHKINDIDYCLSLIDDIKFDFKLCLNAIKAYIEKDYNRSLTLFYDYINTVNRMPETYVCNKIIAHILFEQREYSKSVSFLRYAVSKKPDDLELHKMLQICYSNLNMIQGSEVERQIIEILEVPA